MRSSTYSTVDLRTKRFFPSRIMTINRKKLNTVFTQIINLNNDTIYKKKIDNNDIIYLDLQEKLCNQLVVKLFYVLCTQVHTVRLNHDNRKKLNTVFTQIINLNNDTIYKKKIENNGIIYLDLQEKLCNQLVVKLFYVLWNHDN